jgi:two-component system, chemotaxis family, chemotaxis protein CheY
MASILIIDDEPDLRSLLRLWLEDCDHVVIEAEDGKKGILAFEQFIPDLVITDVFMPEKEGLGVIRAIRNRREQVKVIAMSGGSGLVQGNYLDLAEMLGASATLCKPFGQKAFLNVVREVLVGAGNSKLQTTSRAS